VNAAVVMHVFKEALDFFDCGLGPAVLLHQARGLVVDPLEGVICGVRNIFEPDFL
jgi:hypothetical protein